MVRCLCRTIEILRELAAHAPKCSYRTESSGKDDSSTYDGSAVEVFVGGLPPDTREDQVQQAFSAVGQVISLRLNRRKRTGECKGFGFVRYNDQATAERACAEVQEVRIYACVFLTPCSSQLLALCV